MPLNRDARVAGGKIGGRVVVAKYGPTALGERMRAGLLNKYLRQVDEAAHLVGVEISDAERQQRAEALRLAHLARARKALQDKARRRREQRLEDAQRVYNEARRRAGQAPLAWDGGRCG